jgi:hypothetical protein
VDAAQRFLADKIAAFDESLSTGDAEGAETSLRMVVQAGTVSVLEDAVHRVLLGEPGSAAEL